MPIGQQKFINYLELWHFFTFQKKDQLSIKKKEGGLDRADSFRPYSQIILSKHMKDKQKQVIVLKRQIWRQQSLSMKGNSTRIFDNCNVLFANESPLPPLTPPNFFEFDPFKINNKVNKNKKNTLILSFV